MKSYFYENGILRRRKKIKATQQGLIANWQGLITMSMRED